MTIRTALIGFGWSGQQIWLPRLLAAPEYEVVTALDPDPGNRARFTAVTGRPATVGLENLDTEGVDLAIVALPNHLHARIGCELLDRGVATFIEKPVCISTAEADALAAAEQRGGTPLLAGSAARHRGDIEQLRALLPELGAIRGVDLSWLRAGGIPRAGGWFTNRALAGGGVLVDLGWHLLDVLGDLVGPVTFRQVTAITSSDNLRDPAMRANWRADAAGEESVADVEDTARAFLATDDGIGVGLSASWATTEVTHDLTSIRVAGSEGTATLRCTFGFSPNREQEPGITVVRDRRVRRIPVPAETLGIEYDRLLGEIGGSLTGAPVLGAAIGKARAIVGTIEAIYASAGETTAADLVEATAR
ncbi:Gfo/Idh/MocA family protein [Actinacidiphila oryziradicis]|uniref:Gfo/Idh/MocA family oxidoreductase n=1 Tax=Actinacidiphila oryziradicis TaxID=2571141 RepID=A0A4U0S238_9ACTN|nr:Gfo/Idh/MocA family oxidoreductase [Actinacidiphila oryziradicis]TKA02934.1 Gfo/Idh/MocA family oxidoreductase [Actinacidiphila oryziradicis]